MRRQQSIEKYNEIKQSARQRMQRLKSKPSSLWEDLTSKGPNDDE